VDGTEKWWKVLRSCGTEMNWKVKISGVNGTKMWWQVQRYSKWYRDVVEGTKMWLKVQRCG
jgi:hypothetical protein